MVQRVVALALGVDQKIRSLAAVQKCSVGKGGSTCKLWLSSENFTIKVITIHISRPSFFTEEKLMIYFFQASLMGVSGTTTATTTIPSYEPVRRDSFRPPSLEAADNSLALTGSLSPVDEQVCVN